MAEILDVIFFIFRYIPFWSIPLIMICAQFGYVYWIKEVRWIAYVMFSAAGVCSLFLLYYIIAGSPDRSAELLDSALRSM